MNNYFNMNTKSNIETTPIRKDFNKTRLETISSSDEENEDKFTNRKQKTTKNKFEYENIVESVKPRYKKAFESSKKTKTTKSPSSSKILGENILNTFSIQKQKSDPSDFENLVTPSSTRSFSFSSLNETEQVDMNFEEKKETQNSYQSQTSTIFCDLKSIDDDYKLEKYDNDDNSTITSISCLSCCQLDKLQKTDQNDKNIFQRLKICFKNSKFTKLSYYRNNLSFFIWILIYFVVQILLSILQYFLYLETNLAVRFARIGGILLDFNSCLIILLVLRRLVTWLRNSFIGRNYLPVDSFLKFHKFIGVLILLMSIMHTVAHCVNLYWLSDEYKSTQSEITMRLNNGTIVSKIISNLSKRNLTDIIFTKLNMSDFLFELNKTNSSQIIAASAGASYAELLFTTKSNVGWVFATAMPTGWALLFLLIIIEIFSFPFIRKKGYFQVFYFTHWLHVIYYILLIIHAKNFWKWFIFPFLLVIFERIFTFVRIQSVKYGDTYIKDVNLLSSKVTQLVIPRPPNFKFHSGDYLYIKIPKIARYEWHPFTISSAPELKDELWLHVRSLGNWTNKLYEYFQDFSKYSRNDSLYSRCSLKYAVSETKYERRMSNLVVMIDYKKNSPELTKSDAQNDFNGINKNKLERIPEERKVKKRHRKIEKNLNISNNIKNVWLEIAIDGPYSTPARRIFDSEQVILIAGGIGVTPFASILQSLWFKYSKSLKTCCKCNHQWYDQLENKNLKRVDFIWVNRDYQAFEWFIELLGQLELQQINSNKDERFIGIHLYMTSATVVQEIKPLDNPDFDKKGQIESKIDDFVLKLNPGRPDFDQIFGEISDKKKGKVDVFFCGNRDFGKFVQKKCFSHKFKFYKEYF